MRSREFPLSLDLRSAIFEAIAGNVTATRNYLTQTTTYFSFYRNVVENNNICTLNGTHEQIIDRIQMLRQPHATKASITEHLKQKYNPNVDDADLGDVIDTAARLLLMISTNSPLIGKSSVVVTGETRQQGALSTVIADHFEPPVLNEKVKLDKVFNARNLQQICGIKIRWTSNLADYLMMRNDDTAVEIFHCAAFLRCHENSSLFPKGFIEETIQTLAILLPEHNKDVKTWFKSQQKLVRKRGRLPLDNVTQAISRQTLKIDTAIFQLARECGQLKKSVRQIKNFVYWHDRLLILKQVFDEAEPSTASQWWNDRRKKVQWCTFWVAALVLLLTIFFGLLQGIEGALQVYKAFNP